MPKYTTEQIRNVALVGHTGAGKTTLAEALLHQAGVIGAPGTVEKGDTVCDFDDEERAHQHSLNSAVVSLDHHDHHVNLIDTPGMPDFLGHALAAFPAVESVAVVIDAHAGIEMITRRVMTRAAERKLCRFIVVNKIDADNVDLPALTERIQSAFGKECLPINLPSGGGKTVVDVFDCESGESDFSSVKDAHTAIVDQIVEVDEELALRYLEGETVTPEELHEAFEKSLREGHLIPILYVSAKTGAGLDDMLHIFADLAPNPLEGNPRPFEHGEGENVAPLSYDADPAKHVIAHVWKVTTDPFVGKLSVFRIHQGTIKKDTQLYIGDAKKPFKVGHLFKLHGKDHKEVDAGVPGDICAIAKVEEIHFNDVLHDSIAHGNVHLKPITFPTPMSGFAIEAKSRGDEQKIAKALHAMEAEDPCFLIQRGEETVIRGLGEMHLRIMLEKMKNRYNAEVDTHPPKIPYRETVRGKAEGHHRHKKQTGGAGQFGEVYLRIEPIETENGETFEFVNDTFGGSIPHQFIPAIEKGVRQMLETGCVAGYPMQGVRVSVYDGKHHPVDSKEVAFVAAAKRAFADAVAKAKPAVLEPVVDLEITIPEQNMGDVAGDLSSKRGRLNGQDMLAGGMMMIKAQAPLAEMTQYQNQLKSVTGGQGSFTMEFSHYEPVPPNVQQNLVSEFKPKHDDD